MNFLQKIGDILDAADEDDDLGLSSSKRSSSAKSSDAPASGGGLLGNLRESAVSAYQQVQDTALQQIQEVKENAERREQALREKQLRRESGDFDADASDISSEFLDAGPVRDFSGASSSKNAGVSHMTRDTDVPSTNPSRELSSDLVDAHAGAAERASTPSAPLTPAVSSQELKSEPKSGVSSPQQP